MGTSIRLQICTLALTALAAGSPPPTTDAPAGTAQASGWRSLFDGKTTSGWRGYRQPAAPDGWHVVEGALVRMGQGAGDIVTEDEFDNFELELEWKLPEGGNSGIFYRAGEAEAIWHSAPEYQVLDNARHRDGGDPKRSAGACYDLYAPVRDVTKPIGEWNQVRIVASGAHVEHWMNGQKLLEYEVGSPDWNTRVAASKFKEHPGFGKATKGRIGLQDHGDMVSYRNIRIRSLPGKATNSQG